MSSSSTAKKGRKTEETQGKKVASRARLETALAGKKKALLIGINYVNDPDNRLSGCINDAKNMYKYLQTQGFKESDIKLLTDDNKAAMPTRDNILGGIQWLIKDARSGDSLVFHYSGHGGQVEDEDGDEDDGYDETLCTSDGKEIIDDDLNRMLVQPLPAGVRLTAVMDCCHSGTGMDLAYTHLAEDVVDDEDEDEYYYEDDDDAEYDDDDEEDEEEDDDGDGDEEEEEGEEDDDDDDDAEYDEDDDEAEEDDEDEADDDDEEEEEPVPAKKPSKDDKKAQKKHDKKDSKKDKKKDKKGKKDDKKKDKSRDAKVDKKAQKREQKEAKKRAKAAAVWQKKKGPVKDRSKKDEPYDPTNVKATVILISGCMDEQTSADSSFKGKSAGAMTFALLKTLNDRRGKLTYEELIGSMRQFLEESEYEQIPQLSTGRPFDLTSQWML